MIRIASLVIGVLFSLPSATAANTQTAEFKVGLQDVKANFTVRNIRYTSADSMEFDWELHVSDRVRYRKPTPTWLKPWKTTEVSPEFKTWMTSSGSNARIRYEDCTDTKINLSYEKVTPVKPENSHFTICAGESELPKVTTTVKMEILGSKRKFTYDYPLPSSQYKKIYEDAKYVELAYQMLYSFTEDPKHSREDLAESLKTVVDKFPHDELPLTGIIIGNGMEVFGFVSERASPDTTLVAFRGTQTYLEWNANMAAAPALWERLEVPNLKVHTGFLLTYESLKVISNGETKSLCDFVGHRPTVVVGHSLGAALATLTAVDCATRESLTASPQNISLITLASPRVGNAVFASFAQKQIKHNRFYNAPDKVTWLPTDPPFRHTGDPFAYSSQLYKTLNNDLPDVEQAQCWHSLNVYLWFLNNDHPIGSQPPCEK